VGNGAFGTPPKVSCSVCVSFDSLHRFIEIVVADLLSFANGLMMTDQLAESTPIAATGF